MDTPHTPQACEAGVLRHAVNEHTHRVMQGYWLLSARAVHALPADTRGQGRKSLPSVGSDFRSESPGFTQWLSEAVVQPRIISQATAYNYMQAAINCGITPDMTEAEAEAAAREKLAGIAALSSLYKLPAHDRPTTDHAPPPAPEPGQIWFDFAAEVTTYFAPECEALRLLPRLPLQQLEAVLTTLEGARDRVREVIESKRKTKP